MRWKLILILMLSSLASFGQGSQTLWQEGNAAYKNGNFDTALLKYNEMLRQSSSKVDFQVLANMGNSFYKKGQLGAAILSYQQAIQLAPQEQKLRDNLLFLQSKITTPITKDTASLDNFLAMVLGFMSANTWAIVTLFLVVALATLLIFSQLRSIKYWKRYTLLLAALLILGALGTYGSYQLHEPGKHAVAMAQMTTLYNDAAMKKDSKWQVPEGTSVKILDKKQTMLEVRLPNGLSGFVQAEAFQIN